MSIFPQLSVEVFLIIALLFSTSNGKTHIIIVGDYMFFFTPPTLSGVAVGDYVEFQFPGQVHTVVRGDYDAPCRPGVGSNTLRRFGNGSVWIDGVGGLDDYNTWTILINDTSPFWYYDCTHCAQSMVGVINPPSPSSNPRNQTIEGWRDGHQNVTITLPYGEPRIPQRESCPESEHGGVLRKKDGLSLFDPRNAFETASAMEGRPTGGGSGPVGGGDSEAGAGAENSGNVARKVVVNEALVTLAGVVGLGAWYRGF